MEYAKLINETTIQPLPRNVELSGGGMLMNASVRFERDKALAKSENWWPVERAIVPEDGKSYASTWKLDKRKGKIIEGLAEVEVPEVV